MGRPLAALIVLTVVAIACSSNPVDAYFQEVEAVIDTMRSDSIAAAPRRGTVTVDGVTGVTDARAIAVAALMAMVPPSQVAPEHAALLGALGDLVTAGDEFMVANRELDAASFEAAVLAATDIDFVVRRVGAACEALARRAVDLAVEADIRC